VLRAGDLQSVRRSRTSVPPSKIQHYFRRRCSCCVASSRALTRAVTTTPDVAHPVVWDCGGIHRGRRLACRCPSVALTTSRSALCCRGEPPFNMTSPCLSPSLPCLSAQRDPQACVDQCRGWTVADEVVIISMTHEGEKLTWRSPA